MAGIILPNRFKSQPQYAAEPAANGLVSCIVPWYPGDLLRKKLSSYVPALVATSYGRAFNVAAGGGGLYFPAPNQLILAAGSDFTCIAAIPKAALVGNNPGLWREGNSSSGHTFCIIQGGASLRPWIRVNGVDVLKPASGPQLVAGQDVIIAFRVQSGSRAHVFWGGIERHSGTHTTATASSTIAYIGTQQSLGAEYMGDVAGFWMFDRALSDPEMREYTVNPWQLFKAPGRKLWAAATAGGPSHDLTEASSTQANICSTAAITQDHAPVAAASTQANASSTGSIGAITQAHVLTVSTSTENRISSAVAIIQVQVLLGAASTQGNLGGGGATGIISEFIGAPSAQANLSGVGRVTRPQTLTTLNSTQANLSGTGVISDGIVVEPALTTGLAETIRIKKPGIPAGTPEWLKTLLEILIGRRGNRIEVPHFQALTFSATPTRTECEALYRYTNTVRDSLEQLIHRMDG